jgi:hypothetical protein
MKPVEVETHIVVSGDQHAAYIGWLQYVWQDGGKLALRDVGYESDHIR